MSGKEGDGKAEAEEDKGEDETWRRSFVAFQYPQGPRSHLLFYPSGYLSLPELCLD